MTWYLSILWIYMISPSLGQQSKFFAGDNGVHPPNNVKFPQELERRTHSLFHRDRHEVTKRSIDLVDYHEKHSIYLGVKDNTLWGKNTPVFLARNKGIGYRSISYTHLQDIFSGNFSIHSHIKNDSINMQGNKVNITKSYNTGNARRDPRRIQSDENQSSSKHFLDKKIYRLETASTSGTDKNFHHVIQKRGLKVMGYRTSAAIKKFNVTPRIKPVWCPQNRKLSFKDTVYPQLLVVVDYETYEAHGYDVQTVARYMAAFWNGVDMLFRKIKKPKIRINIAGLIIPADKESVPYMRHIDAWTRKRSVSETMAEMATYFNDKEAPLPWCSYDIVVGISHLELSSEAHSLFGLEGAAWPGSCMNKIYSVALIKDKGDLLGSIATAAHELAHTMGADHDSGPGHEYCSVEGQSIMDVSIKDPHKLDWSNCSILSLRDTLSDESSSCLWNKPDIGNPIPKTLPGKLYSLDEICRKVSQNSEAKAREYDCKDLWCDLDSGTSILAGPAPEGSPCSEGRKGICIEGECVINIRRRRSIQKPK